MNPDLHAPLRNKVLETVLDGPGTTDASIRRGAFHGAKVPADLQPLVDKIERHAYKVTEDDLTRLKSRYSDDELFEIIVGAALGASERRLLAGLRALDDA